MKSALSARPLAMQGFRYFLPIALGLASLTMFAKPALAQEEMYRVLTVTGQGTEAIPTSLTQVQLGVEVQEDTAEAAQREAARRSAAVVELLQSRDVTKLQTTGVYLYPQYDYSPEGDQRIIGYTATNTVSFEIETERAGNLLDEVVSAGATRIDGVSFLADDAAIAAARRDALREATQEALEEADVVLESLGLSRSEVVNIQISDSGYYPPMPYAAMAEARDASTPVIGGEQEVSAMVTLEISY